jgi:hypothetical protein
VTPPLTRIVAWARQLAGEVLRPGDLAVDLTAGNGHDTLALWRSVAPGGRVLAFDLQPAALDRTAARLAEAGTPVTHHPAGQPFVLTPGVHLVLDSHAHLDLYLPGAPCAVVANLGYLPGGDPSVATRTDTTLASLECTLSCLAPGGRLCVVAYPGHPGGAEEAAALDTLLAGLPTAHWQVLRLSAANAAQAPFLLVAQRL